jgi:hypothetical protein
VEGVATPSGFVFPDINQLSYLGLGNVSVVWVREGAPLGWSSRHQNAEKRDGVGPSLETGWRRVNGERGESLFLNSDGTYSLTIWKPHTLMLESYEASYTWDGRVGRLKTPWYSADVITWDYVYLDGRLYHWDIDGVEIWESVSSSTSNSSASTPPLTSTPTATLTVSLTTPDGAGVASADPCATSSGETAAEYMWTYQLLPKTLSAKIPAELLCRSEKADLPKANQGFPYSQLESLTAWRGDDSFLAQLARDINRGYTDYYEVAANTLHFVQALMPYTSDIGDYWQLPVETLARQKGDCEDGAVLYVALMQSLGYSESVRLGVYEGHVFALVEVTSDWKTKIETFSANKCLDVLPNSWTIVQAGDTRLWAIAETTVDPSWHTLGYTGLGCGSVPEESWQRGRVFMLAPDTGDPISLVNVSGDEKLNRLQRLLSPDGLLPSP